MQSNLRQFNQHRNQKNSTGGIIKTRVREIMQYVIDCYLCMLNDDPKFSIAKFKETTTYKFEDLLSDRFVDDYLRSRKDEYFSHTRLNQVIFTKQSSENYNDCNTQLEHPDLIDIYITNLQIDKELSSNPQPYFAIECKRLRNSGSFNDYISDIKKFTERVYTQTRLPYEGQIAFIENSQYTHSVSVKNINRNLETHASIRTIQFLEPNMVHKDFDGSYYSRHFKNYGQNNVFVIYHLMFDYTNIVTD